MRLTLALAATLLIAAPLLVSGPASAAAPPKSDKALASQGQYVDLLPVGLPIVVQGKIVNYVFVHVRIHLSPFANGIKLREKEPFFRDALVRAGHRTPFTLTSDYGRIDEARLSASLKQEAEAIAGRGQIRAVAVTQQAPRRQVATPRV